MFGAGEKPSGLLHALPVSFLTFHEPRLPTHTLAPPSPASPSIPREHCPLLPRRSSTLPPEFADESRVVSLPTIEELPPPHSSLEQPKIFDGTYGESRAFLRSMQLYLLQTNVRDLSQRVVITLNHVRGARVDSWVANKMCWLGTVSNDPELLQRHDVWSLFTEDFLREFVYPTERAEARKRIEDLRMEGIELDAYVHKFRTLVLLAQYDLNAPYTIHLFVQGLPSDLVLCCLERDRFSTFDDWVGAAHKYRLKYHIILAALIAPPLSDEEAFVLSQANLSARQRGLTEEDKARYRREGKCYHCHQHGHISRMCRRRMERPISEPSERAYTSAEISWLRLRALPMEGRRAFVERVQDDRRELWNREHGSALP